MCDGVGERSASGSLGMGIVGFRGRPRRRWQLAGDGDEALDLARRVPDRRHLQVDLQLAAVEGAKGQREPAGATFQEVMGYEFDQLHFEARAAQKMADRLVEGLREREARQSRPGLSGPFDETRAIAYENRISPSEGLRARVSGNRSGGFEPLPRWEGARRSTFDPSQARPPSSAR